MIRVGDEYLFIKKYLVLTIEINSFIYIKKKSKKLILENIKVFVKDNYFNG
jgi:hypothetical protein